MNSNITENFPTIKKLNDPKEIYLVTDKIKTSVSKCWKDLSDWFLCVDPFGSEEIPWSKVNVLII